MVYIEDGQRKDCERATEPSVKANAANNEPRITLEFDFSSNITPAIFGSLRNP